MITCEGIMTVPHIIGANVYDNYGVGVVPIFHLIKGSGKMVGVMVMNYKVKVGTFFLEH